MSFGIRPLRGRVVVKSAESEEKTAGGIILTNASKEKPMIAEVMAVGAAKGEETLNVAPGDKVVFSQYGGTKIKYAGEEYIILEEDDILAVID